MPIYIYRCKNCGVQFEKQQSFSEQPLAWCPECSKKTLYKVYQPVGIVFKGSGFYATDHRSPSGAGRTLNKEKSGESKSIESKSSEGKSGESEASERSSSTSSSETVKEKD